MGFFSGNIAVIILVQTNERRVRHAYIIIIIISVVKLLIFLYLLCNRTKTFQNYSTRILQCHRAAADATKSRWRVSHSHISIVNNIIY